MLWFALACTPEPNPVGVCPDTCDATVDLEWQDVLGSDLVLRSNLVLSSDPAGYAFSGEVLDDDGNSLVPFAGLSEVEVLLNPDDFEAGGTYTVAIDHACSPGAAEPLCRSVSYVFVAGEGGGPPVDPPTTTDPWITDIVLQDLDTEVDVLFVVDNSCGMTEYQAALIGYFPVFVPYLDGVDYHIGVVSTDLDDPNHSGKLRNWQGDLWIHPGTADAASAFAGMANLGIGGSGIERGLGATYTALELQADAYNTGFLRETATLHTVVVSDEEDQTEDVVITDDEFAYWYGDLKADPADRTFDAIVSAATGAGYTGATYLDMVDRIGGLSWDISQTDWGETLDNLGLQAAGLEREFFLSAVPDLSTLAVSVGTPEGVVLDFEPDDETGYIYDPWVNSVTFAVFVPEVGSQVRLTYLPAN